ncbi:unnamed protein product [Notodromas monacha]|uniref:EF-hand domain-containing protein n=1 Tax=Notodromas monacha TaxID=399045 RepID=A0A7R9GFZ9_9CRUS|nr:unnamed protein product [Notodromas monacha]CAG0921317.1 unnamed protein product [Notodromas monacha]
MTELLLLRGGLSRDQFQSWKRKFSHDCPDGRMNLAKTVELFRDLFPSSSEPERFAELCFEVFDRDRRGFIDFKEFLNAVNIATGATLVEKLEWAFKLADADMDGKLDMNEIVELASVFFVFRTGSSGDRMIRFLTDAQKAFFQVSDHEGFVHYQDYLTTALTHKFLYEIFL